MSLIINYSINRLINNGEFEYENKSINLDIESKTDKHDDLHKEILAAIYLMENVKPEQLRIIGIMKLE